MACHHKERFVSVCDGCLVEASADRASLRSENFKLRDEMEKLKRVMILQLRVAQEVIVLCVDQGGLSFHAEGGRCPEDDTCDCPVKAKLDAALKGYEGAEHMCLTCGEAYHEGRCTEKRKSPCPKCGDDQCTCALRAAAKEEAKMEWGVTAGPPPPCNCTACKGKES